MADRLAGALVPRSATIRDAMRALELGAGGIALAVDPDGRLVGLATDGDLRRALLAGATLDDPLEAAINHDGVVLPAGHSRADALDLMRARRIDAIPVLDLDGRPVALHLLHAFLEPADRPNWAVIMAGGRGTRLRPLTDSIPKPMLRVAGRPILERIVLHLVGHGISRIFLSVNYLSQVIEDHFGDGAPLGARIDYIREDQPLGTAGALGSLPDLPRDPLVLLNGDLVTMVDIGQLLDFHAAGRYSATIGTRRYLHTVPFGCVERDGDRIVSIEEKPAIAREINTGIYALGPSVVASIEHGVHATMPDVIERILAQGDRVGAFEVEGDWVDVGRREELVRAREGGADVPA